MLDLDQEGSATWGNYEDLETIKEAQAYLTGYRNGGASFDEVQVDLDFVHGSRVTLRANAIGCMLRQLDILHEATSDEYGAEARLIKSFVMTPQEGITKPKEETKREIPKSEIPLPEWPSYLEQLEIYIKELEDCLQAEEKVKYTPKYCAARVNSWTESLDWMRAELLKEKAIQQDLELEKAKLDAEEQDEKTDGGYW